MARTLTNPEVQPVITQQAVTRITFDVPHRRNQEDTGMILDKPQITVRYQVTSYLANGSEERLISREERFPNWPTAFTTDVKAVYDKVVADAVTRGLISGTGTDEELL